MNDHSSAGSSLNWIFRYKIHHIPFWFCYHYIWWAVAIGNPWEVFTLIFFSHSFIKFAFYLVFQAIGAYFNSYYLIPKFLEKAKYIKYFSYLLITILVTTALVVNGYYVSAWISELSYLELWGVNPGNYFHFYTSSALPSTVAVMTLAMSIKLGKNWLLSRKRQQELEKEKLATELKFLRSQFNPHFLFNTINSIFVLIKKNPEKASDSLAQFSDLLRYQLYECNDLEIPLVKELNYLENYIELEKLRQDNRQLEMKFHDFDSNFNPELQIAPFVLIAFVENAFKHISRWSDRKNRLEMKLSVKETTLDFYLENTCDINPRKSTEVIESGGIGLSNVRRRLDLMYPEHYTLTIDHEAEIFRIQLNLQLHKEKRKDLPLMMSTT